MARRNRTRFTAVALLAVVLLVGIGGGCTAPAGGWAWKRATSAEDALAFLNGTGAYQGPVQDARISAVWMDRRLDFFIFYRRSGAQEGFVPWGHAVLHDPAAVVSQLNALDSVGRSVKDFQVASVSRDGTLDFHLFLRFEQATAGQAVPWEWTLLTGTDDVLAFLNGAPQGHPVTCARIAELDVDAGSLLHVFHQRAGLGKPIRHWGWKLATNPDDLTAYINGTGAYGDPVPGFDISASGYGNHIRFHCFSNGGTVVWVQSPLVDERFVVGEPLSLRAIVTSDDPAAGTDLRWSSSLDGDLGAGRDVSIAFSSAGPRVIEATADGVTVSVPVRVQADLWQLSLTPPSPAELERVCEELACEWVDGAGVDETWAAYESVPFGAGSLPAKAVALARLDLLRHQRFDQPLPFTDGRSLHEHVRAHVSKVSFRLDCGFNAGGGGTITLSRNFSQWLPGAVTTIDDPDGCKRASGSEQLFPYPLKIVVHEARHCEPGDPGHGFCDGRPKDATLENGSGYAQGVLHDVWVWKHGLYDPPFVKEQARVNAKWGLRNIFCSAPTHSNPEVQALIDELLAQP